MKKIFLAICLSVALPMIGQNSKYITKVYDFVPAPGQFVNEIPEWEEGDTRESILAKVNEQLVGYGSNSDGMISLGAFGGYVVFGFDHPVVNVAGVADFKIYGNTAYDVSKKEYASSEPGIVMVSVDENQNGEPDDAWYELAGSEYDDATTMKRCKIVYYKPSADRAQNADPDPNDMAIIDKTYIRWTSNDPDAPEGYVKRNTTHTENSYWPNWVDDATMEFECTRIASRMENIATMGKRFAAKPHDWGYADDIPNADVSGFDIGWAVDADGNSVHLPKIDFIKVYTAVNQENGWIGEMSTEIVGAEDLHPTASISGAGTGSMVTVAGGEGRLTVQGAKKVEVYTLNGALAASFEGDGEVSLMASLYVVRADGHSTIVQVK